MTLYLIGIGLYDEKDITLRGLETVQSCDVVYLEHYTSILGIDVTKLEERYNKKILLATRDTVEKEAEEKLILAAKTKDVALLVVGDALGATTHTDLMLRAKEKGIKTEIIFNASVLNAVGVTGLELYKFGKTTSIVFADNNWLPSTSYDVIKQNKKQGLHTLCLLDIKVAEPTAQALRESAISGQTAKPAPPRFMTVSQGLEVLERIESEKKEHVISDDLLVVGIARLGHPDMKIKAGSLAEIKNYDFGAPLHSIIIPGKLHVVEEEALHSF